MDKFIVSARKYRPQLFNTVVGQAHITTTLKNAIHHNQLAHAFLFCGPRGVGKTTCARILAKTINCENRSADEEACNQCASCVSFDQGTSFNLNELDAASNNSVDDIRDLIEQVRFAPQSGRYKVYIVDEVHMLSTNAFNAFLKTLEEPPSYAIFILATTEKHKILPTILSRCQIFDFKRITPNDTVEHLEEIIQKENIQAERTALHVIAQKSEGCMRDALSMLDKIVSFTGGKLTYANTLEHLNMLDEDYYFRWIDQMHDQQLADALLLFDEIHQKGFEGDTVLEGFSEFIRNLLICKDAKTIPLLEVAEDFKPNYQQYAQKIQTGWLIAALNLLQESIIQYKHTRNKKLHVELLLIKLSYLNQAIELSGSSSAVEKKKSVELSKPVAFRGITFHALPEQPSKSPRTASLTIETPEKPRSTPTANPTPGQEKSTDSAPGASKPTLSSLHAIRNRLAESSRQAQENRPLQEGDLKTAWEQFTDKLRQNGNHASVNQFRDARLEIVDDHNLTIVVSSNIQKRFIENERAELIEHLQTFFRNRMLKYSVRLEETNEPEKMQSPQLSHKEHFAALAAQYPLLQVLKERLRMNIDF
jgi:DNA polymerase-3 subunit gamma/tau